MKSVSLLVMDVDGTLTDGGIYIGQSGEVMKRFHVRDGYAIKHLLPQYGIQPAIITGRKSEIVTKRCEELGIALVMQGVDNKLEAYKKLKEMAGVLDDEVAYIGDDINDVEVMKLVKYVGCPCDADSRVRTQADYVTNLCGGQGSVREFIEWLIKK